MKAEDIKTAVQALGSEIPDIAAILKREEGLRAKSVDRACARAAERLNPSEPKPKPAPTPTPSVTLTPTPAEGGAAPSDPTS